jgi:putative membrane protein
MKFLRNLLTILFVVAMIGVGVLFALQNEVAVPLDILVHQFEPRSLALWLLIALAIGGAGGLLISSFFMVRQRVALGSARRQLTKAREEIEKLHTARPTTGE